MAGNVAGIDNSAGPESDARAGDRLVQADDRAGICDRAGAGDVDAKLETLDQPGAGIVQTAAVQQLDAVTTAGRTAKDRTGVGDQRGGILPEDCDRAGGDRAIRFVVEIAAAR